MSEYVAKNWQKEPITKGELTRMSQGIQLAHEEITALDAAALHKGTNNQSVEQVLSVLLPVDTRVSALTYDAQGRLQTVTSSDGATTVVTSTLGYNATSGRLETITVAAGGRTVTYTLGYNAITGRLETVSPAVV